MKRIRRVALLVIAMLLTLTPVSPGLADSHESMVISGVIDGPLTGGVPKAIEVTALTNIADLSLYGVGSANNGGGSDGEEFTFPGGTLSAGDVVYIASESQGFTDFFCEAPTYTSGAASINGDDAIELFGNGLVIDVFGDISTDGTGEAWEYLDGWAKRVAATGPDGTTFVLANWTFSGPNALDGETRNDMAASPYPYEGSPSCPDPEPEVKRIHEVQGPGEVSPIEGDRVIIEGIVVGDFETFNQLAGFYVQEEDADADANPATSEGIFVFNHAGDDVAVGDKVRVEGTVDERQGNSGDPVTFTQLTNFVDITVVSQSNPLPAITVLDFPTSPAELESLEGMRVVLPQELVISEYFNFDRFGETLVGLPMAGEDRLFQPTAIHDPGTTASAARAAYNAANSITIDDGRTASNPDPAIHPGNGDVFDLDNLFNGGDTITDIEGIIHQTFNLYRVMPTEYGQYDRVNPRDLQPEDVGGSLTVGTLNALNYFVTLDQGATRNTCGPNRDQGCRGADDANELARQRAKLIEALIGMDADIVGLIEVENTAGVEPLADIVAGLNAKLGKDTYRYIKAGENSVVGTDAIKVGIIYKKATVVPNEDPAILDDPTFLDPNNTGDDKNRAALAQTFNQKMTGEKVTVVVNHLKSKGSGCGSGDDDPEAGSCNLTRTLAAQALADWLETDPTGTGDPDFLIIGDLNSYDKETPIDALKDEGYSDLLLKYEGEYAYSFLFGGALGYLDYAMSSATLTPQITGATAWHINSDEPDILDYDTSFKRDAQDALYEVNAFRSSDHDAVLVGLDLNRKLGK